MSGDPEILGPGETPSTFEGNYEYREFTYAPELHRKVAVCALHGLNVQKTALTLGIKQKIVNKILDHPPIRDWVSQGKELVQLQTLDHLQKYMSLIDVAIENVADALTDKKRPKRRDAATKDYLDRYPTGLFIKQRKLNVNPGEGGKMNAGAISDLKERARPLMVKGDSNGEEASDGRDSDSNDGAGATGAGDGADRPAAT